MTRAATLPRRHPDPEAERRARILRDARRLRDATNRCWRRAALRATPSAYDRALQLQRVLRAGLRARAALAHRRAVYPHARRWDDGPCYAVALAARAAAREGIVVEVGRGHHAMLLIGGRWLVDPYGIRPAHHDSYWALGTHAFLRHRWACRWYPGRDRPDQVLVTAIRAALAKEPR